MNDRRWPRDLTGAPPRKGHPEYLRDAAFYAMVARPPEARHVLDKVKTELLWHANQPGLDFADQRRYSHRRSGRGYHPAYQMSAWLRKLAYAFDYSRIADAGSWSSAEEEVILGWLHAAARWYIPQIESRRAWMWRSDGTPSRVAELWGGPHSRRIWAGGPATRLGQHRYNNHVTRFVALVTDVGILTGDDAMKQFGRRWIREFLEIAVYPDGAIADFYRWDDEHMGHLQGWKYGMESLGATIVTADHLARDGDPSGFGVATTEGTRDTRGRVPRDAVTAGGPKTLLTTMRQLLRYIDEESDPPRFACSRCADDRRRITSRDLERGIDRADDWLLLQGNVFYRDAYVRSVYTRSLPGTPPIPERPQDGLGWIHNGDVGTFPGVNFMFAQMEGLVWPYPTPG